MRNRLLQTYAKDISRLQHTQNTSHVLLQGNDILILVPPFWRNFTGCPSMLASSLKLPPSPLKLFILVILHILPACSTGTLHAEPYDPPQLICCQSRDVTCHLVLVVSIQLLLPSGTVSQLMSIHEYQHSVSI